jgi:glycosyltransferase involved in cell wall biosynthesis
MLDISLIICTRNRHDIIPETLEAIKKQTLNREKYEVIIIDQSTNDKTQQILENYPDFKYIKLNSTGISISRNEGIKKSQGKLIAFVDDDILFDENYLYEIVDFFNNSDLKPDVSGGKILFKYLGEKPVWLDGLLLGILGYSDYGNEAKFYDSHPKHVPYTGSIVFKRECIEKIGEFSTFNVKINKNIISNEDVIFANKLKDLGYNIVYNPKMVVYHKIQPEHMTWEYYKNRYFKQGQSDGYTYFLLGMHNLNEIPSKILLHTKRLVESLFLRLIKRNPYENHYQKLRLYYNSGYIKALIAIFINRKNFYENS